MGTGLMAPALVSKAPADLLVSSFIVSHDQLLEFGDDHDCFEDLRRLSAVIAAIARKKDDVMAPSSKKVCFYYDGAGSSAYFIYAHAALVAVVVDMRRV